MIKRNRLILKITSAILLALAIMSAMPLYNSLMSALYMVNNLTASKESMRLLLYILIIALLGVVSFVLQLVAGAKGWKAGTGKDFPDSCKTLGIMLIILQFASIVLNIVLGGFEYSQLIGNSASFLVLFLYTYSATKLIY